MICSRILPWYEAAREEAGAEIELMVDAGWYGTSYANPYKPRPLRDWIRLVNALEELDVFWLEDFLHPDNFAGYAEVAAHTTTLRLAAGEQMAGYEAFERIGRQKARCTRCNPTCRAVVA